MRCILRLGLIAAIWGLHTQSYAQQSSEQVHDWAEVMPQFAGGVDSMNSFISQHLKYPQAAIDSDIQGKVWVRFIIDKTGHLSAPGNSTIRSPIVG